MTTQMIFRIIPHRPPDLWCRSSSPFLFVLRSPIRKLHLRDVILQNNSTRTMNLLPNRMKHKHAHSMDGLVPDTRTLLPWTIVRRDKTYILLVKSKSHPQNQWKHRNEIRITMNHALAKIALKTIPSHHQSNIFTMMSLPMGQLPNFPSGVRE